MSKAIRVTITRTSPDTEWPFALFEEATQAAADFYRGFAAAPSISYLKDMDPMANTCVVYHVFQTPAELDDNHTALYTHIPWWKTTANAAEVDAFTTASGMVVTVDEVTDPDLTTAFVIPL
jgi:hypothetical protein